MNYDVSELLKVIKLASQIILENGGETYRVEETVEFICNSVGVEEIETVATPTGIYITVSTDGLDNRTIVKRINNRSINLINLNKVNNISRLITQHSITLHEALILLEETKKDDETQNKNISLFYGGISSAFFALLFGGGLLEFLVSLVSGTIVSFITKKFESLHSYQFFSSILSGVIIATFAVGSTYIAKFGNFDLMIVSGMMPQLPGLAMTNAIRDAIRGDLVSGNARATEATLVAASLAAGAGVIMSLSFNFGFLSI